MKNFDTRPNHLVREHFREDGLPKVPRTEQEARDYASERGLDFYLCTFCGAWHVAHT